MTTLEVTGYVLGLLSVVTMALAIYMETLIHTLLLVVLVLLMQGLSVLIREIEVLSLYVLIIYLGAVVILFGFMVLFINAQVNEPIGSPLRLSFFLTGVVGAYLLLNHAAAHPLTLLGLTPGPGACSFATLQTTLYHPLVLPLLMMMVLMSVGLMVIMLLCGAGQKFPMRAPATPVPISHPLSQ